jgi:Tfp pilus assembly pilus retraction ATPase PilT
MITLEQSLGALVKDGHVDLNAALRVAAFPEDLEKLVRG